MVRYKLKFLCKQHAIPTISTAQLQLTTGMGVYYDDEDVYYSSIEGENKRASVSKQLDNLERKKANAQHTGNTKK